MRKNIAFYTILKIFAFKGGKDNSFAVIGEVNSKRDRVATTAFLSSVVDGIGKAVSQFESEFAEVCKMPYAIELPEQ